MRRPLPPASATGVRIAGDRFQWLVVWQACVGALLDAAHLGANPVVSIGVEVDGVGNVDDVVVEREHPPNAYKQVKYAVDGRSPVNTDFLTSPSVAGGPSILKKIAAAWRSLSGAGEPVQIAIVTNRQADPRDTLIAGRDSRTRLLMPKASEGGLRSSAGKERAVWAKAADLTEDELLELLSALEFDLGSDPEQVSRMTKLEMQVAGMRYDDDALNLGIDWVARQVIAGRRKLSLNDLEVAAEALQLRSEEVWDVLSIATLAPDPLAAHARHAIDWVDRFEGGDAYLKRHPCPPASWSELQRDIEASAGLLGNATRVVITGSLRLAPAFMAGAALRMVTGIDIAAVQRGQLWRSTASYMGPAAPGLRSHHIALGDELAVAVEIATQIAEDVIAYISAQSLPVANLVTLQPEGGPCDNAVSGESEACALAVGMRDAIRREVRGCRRVHLFLACPMGLALLLGHRWNRIAPTTVYEDLGAGGYEAAFVVNA